MLLLQLNCCLAQKERIVTLFVTLKSVPIRRAIGHSGPSEQETRNAGNEQGKSMARGGCDAGRGTRIRAAKPDAGGYRRQTARAWPRHRSPENVRALHTAAREGAVCRRQDRTRRQIRR